MTTRRDAFGKILAVAVPTGVLAAATSAVAAPSSPNYQPQIDALRADLNAEIANRQSADASLQAQINAVQSGGGDGYGIYVTPSSDDTTQLMNVFASIPDFAAKPIYCKPGTYNFPNGLPVTRRNFSLIALGGPPLQGPGPLALSSGVVFKANTGWVMSVLPPTAGQNEYCGPYIKGITFAGNEQTQGGLRLQSGYALIDNCSGYGHSNGRNLKVETPVNTGSASTQLVTIRDFRGYGSLINIQIGDPGMIGGCQTIIDNPLSIGPAASLTGAGVLSYDHCTLVLGGKFDGYARGVHWKGQAGGRIVGTGFENCTIDIDLDRDVDDGRGSNVVVSGVQYCKIRVGPNQRFDVISGPWTTSDTSGFVNLGHSTMLNGQMLP